MSDLSNKKLRRVNTLYNTGELQFVYYLDENNQIQGEYTWYEVTGEVREITQFKDDKQHGVHKSFYTNKEGQLYQTGKYNHGKKIGVWTTYKPNGEIYNENTYGTDGYDINSVFSITRKNETSEDKIDYGYGF